MLLPLLRKSVIAYSVAVLLVCVTVATGAEVAADARSQAPDIAPQVKAGDVLTVAGERADMMVGRTVLATLPQGQQVLVVDIRDAWIGTYVRVGSREQAGWIATGAFVPTAVAAKSPGPADACPPQPRTVFRPIASETVYSQVPAAASRSRPAQQEEWDAFTVGKYMRHEIDPNVHAWEPWMYRYAQ